MKRVQRIVVGVSLLFICGLLISAVVPSVPSGTWQATGDMAAPRTGATATLFPDGRLMIVGGTDASGEPLASAEFYNGDGSVSAAPSMSVARSGHAAIFLYDGRLLVTGGHVPGGGITNSAEVFDPLTNHWQTLSTTLLDARAGHTVSQLPDGSVLIAGGEDSSGPVSALEVFDLYNNFNAAGSLAAARKDHAAAVLPDGRVLIAGGTGYAADSSLVTLNTTEIYDPATNSVAAGPSMSAARAKHSATTLLDGRVLIAGGDNGSNDLASAETYNPATGAISATDSMSAPRSGHTALLLPNNNAVLIAGGTSAGNDVASAELYESWNNAFKSTGAMTAARTGSAYSATAYDGLTMLAGGSNLASTELYGFATVKTDWPEYVPGDTVKISGSGWQPGETVTLRIHEIPTTDPDVILAAIADSAGNIANQQFSVNDGDLGVKFYLSAKGASSEAQTSFLDAPKVGSVAVGVQSPDPVTAGNSATYTITVSRGSGGGSSGAFTANLSVTTLLPTGATASFSPNPVSFTPSQNSRTATLTVSTTASTPGSTTNFTAKAETSASDFATTTGTLNVTAACSAAAVTTHPSSQAITYGSSASFTAAASGNPTPTVQWQVDSGSGFTYIPGATSTTLTLTQPPVSASGNQYRAVFTNTCNGTQTATSNAETLTVNAKSVSPQFTANNKAYDGTTAATIATRSLTGSVAGDDVALAGGTASFDNANAGTGKTVTATGFTLSGSAAGNYVLSSTTATTTADITAAGLTPSFTADNKAYDGTTSATILTRSISGVIGSDDVSLSSGTATFDSKNVATGKTVTASGFVLTGAQAGNYTLASTTATDTADITAATVTPAITVQNKVYDATTAATIATRTLTGAISGDDVSLTGGTATFADKNVGTGKTVTATGLALSGADAGNYLLSATTATATADITPRDLTVTATGVDKVYDATTAATVTLADNRVVGDVLTTAYTSAAFADKNVANAKSVSVTGISISGADAGNYNLTDTTASATANITPKSLLVTATGVDKVYDGTTDATVTLADDRISGDVFTADYASASFADKHVGTGKTVSVSGISISGPDAGNYSANTTATATANITARPITVSAVTDTKEYDGTTTSTSTPQITSGSLASVDTANFTQTFDNRNAGTGKTLTPTGAVNDGNSGNNYAVTFENATGTIQKKPITVTAVADTKTYDGTPASSATPTIAPALVSGDVGNFIQTFDNKNAGTGKTLTPSGSVNDGNSGNNYEVTFVSNNNGVINPRSLTVTATGVNKVYDGTTVATVNLADNRIAGDVLTLSSTASFNGKNVGTAKPVSVTAIQITGGADAGNYTLANTSANTTADITPRALTVTAMGVNKVYDGNTSATVTLSDDRVAGDILTTAYTNATFADKNVGNAKTISVTGITVTGADAGNYTFNTTAAAAADITPANLVPGFTAADKVYDGTVSASILTRSLSGIIGGDVVSLSGGTATFDTRNVGTGKTVTASGFTLTGADAGNYQLSPATATTLASITPATLVPQITANGKTYDGTTVASLSSQIVNGVYSPDVVSLLVTAANFDTATAGNGKLVTATGLSLSGADAGNYVLSSVTATATANILPKALTITADNKTRLLNAPNPAFTVSYDGFIAGEGPANLGGTLSCSSSAVTSSPVGAYPITCGGQTSVNYAITYAPGTLTVQYATGGMCLGSAGHQILEPINWNGTSVFKQKSTVPAKFRVCDANGNSIGTPGVVSNFVLLGVLNGTIIDIVTEEIVSTTPDTAFRWDPTSQQWIFNLNTKNLKVGATYVYEIRLNDGSKIGFQFGLK